MPCEVWGPVSYKKGGVYTQSCDIHSHVCSVGQCQVCVWAVPTPTVSVYAQSMGDMGEESDVPRAPCPPQLPLAHAVAL